MSTKITAELEEMIKRQVARSETEIADLKNMLALNGAETARNNSVLANLDDKLKKHKCRLNY